MRTLLIVDLQYDFFHPEGALYVPGAASLPARIARIVPHFDHLVFTLDWHPADHVSFKPNGGIWPVHCVRYSRGAALAQEVLDAAAGIPRTFCCKGQCTGLEEYGAFAEPMPEVDDLFRRSGEIVVTGLCGDYCVGQTVQNLVRSGLGDRLRISMACTGSIDDGGTLRRIIDNNHLQTL